MISNRSLSRWLDRLTDLPPEAHEWEMIAGFLNSATAIATEKLRQQREAGPQKLREEIGRLISLYEAGLLALDLTCDQWQAEACARDQATTVAQQVVSLQSNFADYLQLELMACDLNVSLAERHTRRKQLEEKGEEIKILFGNLKAILSQVPDPAPDGGTHQGTPPLEEPATDSEGQAESPDTTQNGTDSKQRFQQPTGGNFGAVPTTNQKSDPSPPEALPKPVPATRQPSSPATHIKVAESFGGCLRSERSHLACTQMIRRSIGRSFSMPSLGRMICRALIGSVSP